MKQKEKIRLLMLFMCLLIAFGVVHAQEGCGVWLKTGGCFNIQQMLEDVDSVWIPMSCADMRLDGVRDTVRQMTIEEKVELLFTMIRRLEAEINCLRIKMEGK